MALGYSNLKIYSFGQMCNFLLAFGTMISLTYILSPEEYGSWVIITQIVMVSAMASSLGIDATIVTEYNDYSNHRNLLDEMISSIFGFRVILAISAGLLWAILSTEVILPIGGSLFGVESDLIILSIAIGTFFSIINSSLSLFKIQERSRDFVAIQIFHPTTFFIGIMLLNFYFKVFDLRDLAYVYFICAIFASIVVSAIVFREFGIRVLASRVIGAIKRDFPLIVYSFASWSLISLDRFVIEFFDSLESVGIYSLAYSSAIIFISLASVLDNVYAPIFYSNISKEKRRDMGEITKSLMKMLSILAIIVNLVALIIVQKIAPNEYSEGIWIVPWVIVAGFIQSMQFIYVKPLFYNKKSLLIAIICTISAITNLLLNIVLVPKFGYEIAAPTTLLSYTIMTMGIMRFSKDYFEFGFSWTVPIQCLSGVVISNIVIFSIFVYFGALWAILTMSIIVIWYSFKNRDIMGDSGFLFGY